MGFYFEQLGKKTNIYTFQISYVKFKSNVYFNFTLQKCSKKGSICQSFNNVTLITIIENNSVEI